MDPSVEAWLPAAPASHSGWLWKEGHKAKSWKRRWFELERGRLLYRAEPGSTPLGTIHLAGATQADAATPRGDTVAKAMFGAPQALSSWLLRTGAAQRARLWEIRMHDKYALGSADGAAGATEWRRRVAEHARWAELADAAAEQLASVTEQMRELTTSEATAPPPPPLPPVVGTARQARGGSEVIFNEPPAPSAEASPFFSTSADWQAEFAFPRACTSAAPPADGWRTSGLLMTSGAAAGTEQGAAEAPKVSFGKLALLQSLHEAPAAPTTSAAPSATALSPAAAAVLPSRLSHEEDLERMITGGGSGTPALARSRGANPYMDEAAHQGAPPASAAGAAAAAPTVAAGVIALRSVPPADTRRSSEGSKYSEDTSAAGELNKKREQNIARREAEKAGLGGERMSRAAPTQQVAVAAARTVSFHSTQL